MIVLYPDTNALYSDLLMRHKLSGALLGLLDKGVVEVRLSPVVVAEADRQVRESVEATGKGITTAVAKAKRSLGLPEASTKALINALTEEIDAMSDKALAPLIAHSSCEVIAWSDVSAEELVDRELERRKPVLESKGQSIGLRDTIIWHGLLEVLESLDPEEDFAIFVTADGGFVKNGELHDELYEEVDWGWAEGNRFRVATSLASAVLEAEKLASLIGAREATLTEALIEYISNLKESDLDGTSFPNGLDDTKLVSVEGVEVDSVGEGNPAECIGYADLTFSGRMHPMDYQYADLSEIDMTGGDVDGLDVYVEYRTRATITAEIEFDLEQSSATVVGASVSW